MEKRKPICLLIRDGWGKGKKQKSNAIYSAHTPFTDSIEKNHPCTLIETSGLSVGLPEGYQGNSEVGHLNIGAGRIVYQSLTRIDLDIKKGLFFKNKTLLRAIQIARERRAKIHLMGLIQEEGVHAVTRHSLQIIKMCQQQGLKDVLIHAFTDGRDTPPKSANQHMKFLQEGINQIGVGQVATVMGRYYAMDRDRRWDRTQLAYNALMKGEGKKAADWEAAIEDAYNCGETDEFIKPRIINYKGMDPQDVVIFFNFRFDRTRQLTKALVEDDFSEFPTQKNNIHLVTMTHYYDNGNFHEAFPELEYRNILGEIISSEGLKQLRIAETEKYAHVTFFMNAFRNEPFKGEDQVLIESPKVPTYDLQPEMSAYKVRDGVINALNSSYYDLIVCNFANCDMVGHTGIFEAIVKAVETVDICTRDITQAVLAKGGVCILTADHGNAEETALDDGSPMTAHTTNPVPFSLVGAGEFQLRTGGKLSDIAPTILKLMKIKKPPEMDGKSLIPPLQ
jgi:2,3-bisphosphoglycerate-independent phosphoglycerate mutase